MAQSSLLTCLPNTSHFAIISDVPLSFHELRETLEDLTGQLKRIGCKPGHRVATLLDDHQDSLLITLSLLTSATVVPLNKALSIRELQQNIREADVQVVVADTDHPILAQLDRPVLRVDGCVFREAPVLPVPAHAHQTGLILLTSGSSGTPKQVFLQEAQLIRSAQKIAQTLELATGDCVLHALPMFHIGALVDLCLAPWIAGSALHVASGKTPTDFETALRTQPITWLQLVPTMLLRCLSEWEQPLELMDSIRFIRSVSADLVPDLHARAEDILGNTPIVQMYGMTETTGQIASNPLPPATRKPGSVGLADGAEIRIADPTGSKLDIGAEGEVCVRGPQVFSGYEETDHTVQTFWGDWFRTGDLGYLDEDGFLFLTGRLKNLINRGGEKISPIEIERAALMAIPEVQEAVAYPLPHPSLGEQVGLTVQLAANSTLQADDIIDMLKESLVEFKCPRTVRVLETLPRLGSGKVDRMRLQHDHAGPQAPNAAKGWTGLAAVVAKIWCDVLERDQILETDDFFDVGGDSLSAAHFIETLERQLGRPLQINTLFNSPRFGDLTNALQTALEMDFAPTSDPLISHLMRLSRGWRGTSLSEALPIFGQRMLSDKPPLFVLSQGEGQAFIDALPSDRPTIHLPTLAGFLDKEANATSVLAARYAIEIHRLQPQDKIYMLGFCEGARLGRAVGEILKTVMGREIGCLVSIDKHFREPTEFPVCQVYTECKIHAAPSRYKGLELGYRYLFPQGIEVEHWKGVHIHAVIQENINPLMHKLENWMQNQSSPLNADPRPLPGFDRSAAREAIVTVVGPELISRDQPTDMRLSVTNTSTQIWPASNEGGFAVAADFVNLDKVVRARGFAVLPLDQHLRPGETAVMTLPVTYPKTSMPVWLQTYMIDPGIETFARKTSGIGRKLIWRRPFS